MGATRNPWPAPPPECPLSQFSSKSIHQETNYLSALSHFLRLVATSTNLIYKFSAPDPEFGFCGKLKDKRGKTKRKVQLKCKVDDPEAKVKWFKDGKEIKMSDPRWDNFNPPPRPWAAPVPQLKPFKQILARFRNKQNIWTNFRNFVTVFSTNFFLFLNERKNAFILLLLRVQDNIF